MELMFLLFLLLAVVFSFLVGYLYAKNRFFALLDELLRKEREDAIKRSRSVLVGNFSEQISPYLPGFPVSPSEVKFLGKPVDFIGFIGIDEQDIKEVVFIEVKTGNSRLNKTERSLREAIESGRVRFVEYRVGEE